MLNSGFFQEESGDILVPLNSEGLEEETMRPSVTTLWPSLIMNSVHGGTKVAQGQNGREGSFMHVQNSIHSEVRHPKTIRLNTFFSR